MDISMDKYFGNPKYMSSVFFFSIQAIKRLEKHTDRIKCANMCA